MLSILLEFALPAIVAVIGVWIAFSIVVWATGGDTLLDLAPAGPPPGLGDGEPVSEAAIASVKFDTGPRGYRTEQVDAALYRLAWEIGRKDEQIAALRARLDGAGLDGTDMETVEPAGNDEALWDEDTFRLTREAADREGAAEAGAGEGPAESEAGREDEGEAPRRGDA